MYNYEDFLSVNPPLRKNAFYIRVNLDNTITVSGKLSSQFSTRALSVRVSRDGKTIVLKDEPNAPLKLKVSNVIRTNDITQMVTNVGLKPPCVYNVEWSSADEIWVCKYNTTSGYVDKRTPSKPRKRKPEGMVIGNV